MFIIKYPAFVNGNELFIRYKGRDNLVYRLFDSLLNEEDIIMPSQLNRKRYSGKLEILGVGRFEKEKGFGYLLQAINLLVNSYREEVYLTLIGAGSQEDELKEYVRANRLEDYINIAPFIKYGKEFLILALPTNIS